MVANWLEGLRRVSMFGLGSAGAYVAATFAGVVNVPDIADPRALACMVRDEAQLRFGGPLPPPEQGVRILVARLELDKDGKQTRHVVDSLAGTPGFEIQPLCRTLGLGEGRDTSAAMRDAISTGRTWLHARNGTILVWGQVEQDDKSVRLRLLSEESEAADRFLTLADDLRLPKDYAPQLSVMLAASVLSQSLALTQDDDSGKSTQASAQLLELLPQLRVLASSAGTLPPDQANDAREAYLAALIKLTRQTGDAKTADQTGDLKYAEEALAYTDTALATLPKDDGTGRATTLFWRARALTVIANRTVDIAKLQDAAATYGNLNELWTRQKSPREWARTQTYLGSVLRRLGDWQDDDSLIEKAIAVYQDAVAASPRKTVPLDWARAQSGLGGAYRTLGESRHDAKLIESAVAAYEGALAERPRAQVPLDWASTQSNLANAMTSLAKLKKDPALAAQAAAAYQQVLEVRTRETLPLSWASTQDRLGSTLLLQGRLTGDDTKIEAAVAAFRGALEERTQERSVTGFASTKGHLGDALAELAERRQDAKLYDQAADALNAAITVYDQKGLAGPADDARSDLAAVESKRAALKGS